MSWDVLYTWSQVFAVLFAAVALVSGFVVNKRQSEANSMQAIRLVELETDLSKQVAKTEHAKQATLELEKLVREARSIDRQEADTVLSSNAKGTVNIGFVTLSDEPGNLAVALTERLVAWGWNVPSPNASLVAGGSRAGITMISYGETAGSVIAPETLAEPARTLYKLLAVVKGNLMLEAKISPDVPPNTINVMIGPKY